MKSFIKKLSTMALFAFVMSSPVFAISDQFYKNAQEAAISYATQQASRQANRQANGKPQSQTQTAKITVILPTVGGPYNIYQKTFMGKTINGNPQYELPKLVSPEVDGTYLIDSSQLGVTINGKPIVRSQYFLALRDGTIISGSIHAGNEFAGKATWTFSVNGKINTIS